MILRWLLSLVVVLTSFTGLRSEGQEKPIRALLITGGCCHDYSRQKLILSRGISARANVRWTIVQQGGTSTNARIPLYEDPKWADNYDVIVHNECFSNVPDVAWMERILKPHREGKPAILIHCAMHGYRNGTDGWFRFCGMQSPGHGPHYAYTVEATQPDNPITKSLGKSWTVPKGELYHSIKLFDTATALGQAKRRSDSKPQICVWTNQYHKARVFATTIGHYNETMVQPEYLDMLTRGLLWSVGADVKKAFRTPDEATNKAIAALATAAVADSSGAPVLAGKCCGEGNLAFGRKTQASSEEIAKKNFARNAVDGDLRTRWCASGSQAGETWQVELEKPQHVKAVRIHWESENTAYKYQVFSSADGKTWKQIVDYSKNKKQQRVVAHKVNAPGARYLQVKFLGANRRMWGSFWEFEASDSELPELPKAVASTGSKGVSISDVSAPADFDVTMFGAPPAVNYPVCLAAAADGTVFVGVDEQGSLGKEPGRGKVLRCIDTDGDGVADQVNEFARMNHPRGLFFDNHSLWVLHPPFLSVFHDEDHDGKSDRQEILVKGITTDQLKKRGADHTTNGIRVGIDGWIYIAVGDFGFVNATAADGTKLTRRGGGILRIRPNGKEMEVFSWGQRNILDVCIDPYMNIFTRDNTNDGGGWDIRVSHVIQSGLYGYPSLYKNFTDEMMPPLADYGGGSGCGGMFLHDMRWPEKYRNTVYTCDWGRSEVYSHNLPAAGATFAAQQDVFLKIPRPTDIDVDGSGRMYVASWKNGKFNYGGPNVGFVAQLVPRGYVPKPFPDLNAANDAALISYLKHPSAVYRMHSQWELLRRGVAAERVQGIMKMIADETVPLYGRVAALYTLTQMQPAVPQGIKQIYLDHPSLREFVLRSITDRKKSADIDTGIVMSGLQDSNPRVRAQALISLGRLGAVGAAESILPLTARESQFEVPTKAPLYNQPDPGRVIPHLAVRALVAVGGVEACLKALGGPHHDGAQWALKYMHGEDAVQGLIKVLGTQRDELRRRATLTTLIRLYHREGDYQGDWWGTRPDTSGPYYARTKWEMSLPIASVIRTAVTDADPDTAKFLKDQLARHRVSIDGLAVAAAVVSAEDMKPIVLPKADPNDATQIGNQSPADVIKKALASAGSVERGQKLFVAQSCAKCHTTANGQRPKGPHLVDIGKRYKSPELLESILKPSAKIAQGFDTYGFVTTDGKIVSGFVASESAEDIEVRLATGVPVVLVKTELEERVKQMKSMMPEGLVSNLTPAQLADLLAYLQSLK